MIVGNGDIAKVLQPLDRDDVIFFASGVSNSQETRDEEFEREFRLLMSQSRFKHLVYFSTLSIFHSNTPYTEHKKRMESAVKSAFDYYTIVRIGNITWGDNPNTFLNYIKSKIENNEPYEIKDEYRYLVDKEEFLYWVGMIPFFAIDQYEMNITGDRLKVADAINKYGGK